MKLVIFILNKEERLQEVLEALLELDINGATIVDSVGMGRIMAHDIPIFAGFRNLLQDSRPGNKTILTIIEDKKSEPLLKGLEQIVGDLNEPGNGIFLTLPIDFIKGVPQGTPLQ
jgi:nitrogen regulatory protein PII